MKTSSALMWIGLIIWLIGFGVYIFDLYKKGQAIQPPILIAMIIALALEILVAAFK